MKLYVYLSIVAALFVIFLGGCELQRDLSLFVGTWETTTYVFHYVTSTNGVETTNYYEYNNRTNYATNYIYAFDPNNVGTKTTLTNEGVYSTESMQWILDEIGKSFTVYLTGTNERFEYAMVSNNLRITGKELIIGSNTIDIFSIYDYVNDIGFTHYEYSLQYIECSKPISTN